MTDKVYRWQCENPICGALNSVEKKAIDDAWKESRRPLLICYCCGYVYQVQKISGKGEDWVESIPFAGTEKRIPTGITPEGNFLDYQGKIHNRNEFIIKYGIDPKRYLEWAKYGKPKCDR